MSGRLKNMQLLEFLEPILRSNLATRHDGMIHVLPHVDYDVHFDYYLCWCQPECTHRDMATGDEVWVHKMAARQIQDSSPYPFSEEWQ